MSNDGSSTGRLDRRGFLGAAAGAAATGAAATTLGPWAGKAPGQDGGKKCAEVDGELPKARRGAILYTMPATAWPDESTFLDTIEFLKSLNCNAWEFAGTYPQSAGNNPAGWVALGSYAKTYGFRVVGTHDGPNAATDANLGSAITKMNAWNCNQLGAGSGWPGGISGGQVTTKATVQNWQASCATMNSWGQAFQTGNGSNVIPTPYGDAMFNAAPVAGRKCARYYRHFHSEQGGWITGTNTKYDNHYISELVYTELDFKYAYAQSDLCWLMEGLWQGTGGPGAGIQGQGDPNPGQGNNRLFAPDIVERWQDRIATFHCKDLGPTDQGTGVANVGDDSGVGSPTAPYGAVPWDDSQDTTPFQAIFERLRHPECHEFLFERDSLSPVFASSAYYQKCFVQAFDMFDNIELPRKKTRARFKRPRSHADWQASEWTGIGKDRPPKNGGAPGPKCPPKLHGGNKVGDKLRVSKLGSWARFNERSGHYCFIWLRDGAPLTRYKGAPIGAKGCRCCGKGRRHYVLHPDDAGHEISCQVTVNRRGAAATVVTNAIAVEA